MISTFSSSRNKKRFLKQDMELASAYDKSHLILKKGNVAISDVRSSCTASKGKIVRGSTTYGTNIGEKIRKKDSRIKLYINPKRFDDDE